MATPYSAFTTFDHVAFSCPAAIFDQEIKFLEAALAPLGIKEQKRVFPLLSALGAHAVRPDFWLSGMRDGGPITEPVTNSHLAFRAENRNQVDEFHRLGVAAGGKDNGAPGLREHFGPGYYASFVISPAGSKLEVIFRDPSAASAAKK